MAYTANTSRRIPAGTQNISTYGADSDGRNYGPATNGGLVGWFTTVASSTNVEILDVYLETGQTSSIYSDYITGAPAQSGPRIIRPAGSPGEASWQGHNGTRFSGVGFDAVNTTDSFSSFFLPVNTYLYGLILKAKPNWSGVGLPAAAGTIGVVGCIIYNTSGTTTSRGAINGGFSGTICYALNNICYGFYMGVRGQTDIGSVCYNNTFVGMTNAPIDWASGGVGRTHYYRVFNNTYYDNGAVPIYNSNSIYSGTNVTMSSSDDFVDYAGEDYRTSTTASEAIGQGTDFSTDVTYDFDDDVNNVLRDTWDIGPGGEIISISNIDFALSRNIFGYKEFDLSRNIFSYSEFDLARNIGLVLTDIDLSTSRNVNGYLSFDSSRNIFGYRELNLSRHIYGSVLGYSSFTEYFRFNIFQHIFGLGTYTTPSLYLGLSTTDPLADGSGITEPSGGSYSRVLVSSWGTPSEGIVANSSSVRTPRATGEWGNIGYIFWSDSLTGGNVLCVGRMFNSIPITGDEASGQALVFQMGSLKLAIENNIFNSFANSILTQLTTGGAMPTGDISYGLSLDTPDSDGSYTEVSATGYSRVVNNDMELINKIFTNTSSIDFPEVQTGNDWGTIADYLIFINSLPFAFGSITETVIDYSTYGTTGFSMQANSNVIEVL